jgi:TATA-box binding protein (TBP) (component of TFIID and TFIIIB)
MNEYSYINDTIDIDLDDYEFDDPENITQVQTSKPEPGELKFSTRTINLSIFPNIDISSRIKYIRNKILPNYPVLSQSQLTDDHLKFIILYRIIKDSIPYEIYFNLLANHITKTPDKPIDTMIKFKINNTQSTFIDTVHLYNTLKLSLKGVNTVMMRNKPIRTLVGFENKKLGFRNQVTFRILSQDQSRTINIMIFQNGRMTMTGCRTDEDVEYISEIIKNVLVNSSAINSCYTKNGLYMDDLVNQSMNCHYDLKFKVNNNELYNLFNEYNHLFKYIVYDPNKFAGLKVQFNETETFKGTVCIFFQSGKINIYRSASTEEIHSIYSQVNDLMTKHYQRVKK